MKRRVCYVSGTRADFGLLCGTLRLASRRPQLDVSVLVTGMHLSAAHGLTVHEIQQSGLPILDRIPVDSETSSGATMAIGIGRQIIGMTDTFQRTPPDIVVVLGDRGEMLAGAVAAIHLNIPVAHVHGGERSGTVDEPIRHAISKLAHFHFVATTSSRERLIRMGEQPERIFVVGAPALDSILELETIPRDVLCKEASFDTSRPIALFLFHPVLQEEEDAGRQTAEILTSLKAAEIQTLCMMPNSDAGGNRIREVLREFEREPTVRLRTHLERTTFLSWMSAADFMIGNSSSGIIEAASFGLPVVNVGTRQNGRERSGNVIDCNPVGKELLESISAALNMRGRVFQNVYGDGRTGERIADLLECLPLNREILLKSNAY